MNSNTNIGTLADYFSYYVPPIKNIRPLLSLSLESVHKFIVSDSLKQVTGQVRFGELKKYLSLPFITPSGVFEKRCLSGLKSYSGIVSIDLDHVNIHLKERLFRDSFLKPALIFLSPSGKGLKLFIRVTNSSHEHHNDYFKVIATYLYSQYRLEADKACSDVSRACFLCYDSLALFSPFGSVSSESLLEKLSQPPAFSETLKRCNTETPSSFSLQPNRLQPVYQPSYYRFIADKLNRCSAVHDYAVGLLKQAGWTQTGSLWTRPGKHPAYGKSASFRFYDHLGIHLFHNFSSSTSGFSPNKSYNDCQLISKLAYNSDFKRCIADLQFKYNPLIGN
jgi:hypothetical protein